MPTQKEKAVRREIRRDNVMLRTIQGATMRTIANELGCSLGTIQQRLEEQIGNGPQCMIRVRKSIGKCSRRG